MLQHRMTASLEHLPSTLLYCLCSKTRLNDLAEGQWHIVVKTVYLWAALLTSFLMSSQCPNLFRSHDLIWRWVIVVSISRGLRVDTCSQLGAQCLAHAKPWSQPMVQPMVMVIMVPVIAMVTTVKCTLLWQWLNLSVTHLQFTSPYFIGLYQWE